MIRRLLAVAVAMIVGCVVPSAGATNGMPDLVVSAMSGDPSNGNGGTYVTTITFDPNGCEVAEGLISSPGLHRLLAFSMFNTNIGTADLRIGNPASHPEWFVWSPCHGHYHFAGYANYRLLDLAGNEVAAGHKVGFCIMDSWPPDNWDPSDPHTRQRFTDCDHQGLSAGWSDVYAATVHGQWIEIDNVAPGDYQIEITINPLGLLPESDYGNNTRTIPATIPP